MRDEASPRTELGWLADELRATAEVADATERLLEAAAIVSEALRSLDLQPVVVGGLAVAYWTDGAFLTADIDLVVRRARELPARLEALGFERRGRQWILTSHPIALEAPGEALAPSERAEAIELASGRRVLVLSIEDLLLWRLREWVHWEAISGFDQAASLFSMDALDAERLDQRAAEDGLAPALAELRCLVAELERGRSLEPWEIVEAARRAASPARGDDAKS